MIMEIQSLTFMKKSAAWMLVMKLNRSALKRKNVFQREHKRSLKLRLRKKAECWTVYRTGAAFSGWSITVAILPFNCYCTIIRGFQIRLDICNGQKNKFRRLKASKRN